MPDSIYSYMQENFFQYLCNELGDNDEYFNVTIANYTSHAAPLQNCQCDGKDYFGMPDVEFGIQIDQYETKYVYLMPPSAYMTLPKVDPNLRVAKCSLGFWNLQ